MKNARALLAAIKQVFAAAEADTTTSTVYKLNDGTEISVSKLDVGGTVMIAGTPAPANTYTLEDGTTLTVDASGVITEVKKPEASSTDKDDKTKQAASSQKFEVTEDQMTAEGMRKLCESFATGTPEERLANLEMVAKALMEYSFGWEIRKAKEEADRAAAIKVYTDQLATTQNTVETLKQAMSKVVPLLAELAGLPDGEAPGETKKKFSHISNGGPKKGLEKYAQAMAEIKPAVEGAK